MGRWELESRETHGQDHRLSGIRARRPALRADRGAHQALARVRAAALGRGEPDAGRALHGLRHSLLSQRLSGTQSDPGLERSCLPRQLAGGGAQPAQHQQFSGSDRPHLPGAVRSFLHAQPRRQSRYDKVDRMRDRRPRLRGRLDRAGAALRAHRQKGGRGRLRTGGTGLRPAARARRPRGARFERLAKAGGFCATAFPTSRWRSITSTRA